MFSKITGKLNTKTHYFPNILLSNQGTIILKKIFQIEIYVIVGTLIVYYWQKKYQEMIDDVVRLLNTETHGQLRSVGTASQGDFSLPEAEYQQIRKVVLIITGCLFGLLIILIIGRCLRNQRICRVCNCWGLNKSYQKFKHDHNLPQPGDKTEQAFDREVSKIVKLINRSQTENNFTFLKSGLQHATRVHITLKKKKPFLYAIHLDGHDFQGSYEGKGYIVAKSKYPLIWFFKNYDDRKKAQQEGDFADLVFESFLMSSKGIGGKWFHVGLETSAMNSGKWKIIDSQLVDIINTEKHLLQGNIQSITQMNSPNKNIKFPK